VVIGVDFDNTLIHYDRVFKRAALEAGLVQPGCPESKREVRDRIRSGPGGDLAWQRLQAKVYGPRISEAEAAPGALAFLQRCARAGVPVHIISHKTETAALDPGAGSLRQAALDWLAQGGFLAAVAPGRVHFGATRGEKLAQIRAAGCTHFIDDLEEVFLEPDFPPGVAAILYAPGRETAAGLPGVILARSWAAVAALVLP
jgi:hypothetical protein